MTKRKGKAKQTAYQRQLEEHKAPPGRRGIAEAPSRDSFVSGNETNFTCDYSFPFGRTGFVSVGSGGYWKRRLKDD